MSGGILVSVPPRVEFVHVVRSVVSGVAARLGFSLDEIEDLTLVADEACATVLEAGAPEGPLRVEVQPEGDVLRIQVRTEGPVDRWPPDLLEESLGWQVLTALADEIGFDLFDGSPVLTLTRRRGAR